MLLIVSLIALTNLESILIVYHLEPNKPGRVEITLLSKAR